MAVKAFVWSTVAELKVYLGIPSGITDFDDGLEDMLNQSAKSIETMLGRTIVDLASNITELQDGDPDDEGQFSIQVKSNPINAFTSIAFNTGTPSTPVWSVEDADNYTRDDETGVIYFADQFDPFSRPIPQGRQNVQIIYQGGYLNGATTMPDDIILALHMQTAKVFQKRKSQGLVSERVANTSITWNKEIEAELQQIFDTYRRYF